MREKIVQLDIFITIRRKREEKKNLLILIGKDKTRYSNAVVKRKVE